MKTIGIIGGIGPSSTLKYYEWLNAGVMKALGDNHSAKIILTSLDGAEVDDFRRAVDDDGEGRYYAREAQKLEQAGADFIIIASNTSHKNVPYIEEAVSIPLLHLADVTARRVAEAGVRKVAVLGTAYILEHDFYTSRLSAAGLEVLIPRKSDRVFMNDAVNGDLYANIVRPDIVAGFEKILKDMKAAGAEGAILGCTELTLLGLKDGNPLPLFDTARIHVEAALDYALERLPLPAPSRQMKAPPQPA